MREDTGKVKAQTEFHGLPHDVEACLLPSHSSVEHGLEAPMLDAVILGVSGVLVPGAAFCHAALELAAVRLARHGVSPAKFLDAAHTRHALHGSKALIARTLHDIGVRLSPDLVRQVVVAARQAAPMPSIDVWTLDALRDLSARRTVGFFDCGNPVALDACLAHWGLLGFKASSLWAGELGAAASPPRTLAFRWLSRRLDVPGARCLHVAGTGDSREAARRAGWRVWPSRPPCETATVDLWQLVDWIDGAEGASDSPWISRGH